MSEFLKQFKTIDECFAENLEATLACLHRGLFVINKEKFRIEFLQVRPWGHAPIVVAWIDLCVLIDSKNPQKEFEAFIKYRLLPRAI